MSKITILGAGNMGTALAHLIGSNGHSVTLWGIDEALVKNINLRHENKKYLPGVKLPVKVRATADLSAALKGSSLVVLALPTQVAREVMNKAKKYLTPRIILLSVAKGLDLKTGQTVSQILKDVLPRSFHEKTAVLMGPLFASEISQRIPSVGLIATKKMTTFERLKDILENDAFFVRFSDDVLGAELGGALKNVYAILLGVCDGLGYGWNTKSATVAAAMRELADGGHYLGAKKETLYGLAGMGDLLTTGFGAKSRNRRFGEKICQGKSAAIALKEIGQVVEGVKTVEVAVRLLKNFKKETPLLHAVYHIVRQHQNPCRVFQRLLREGI